ncbi:MAG: CHASE2 domain-containing protein [Acidobacteriota bacterium]
MRRVWIAIAGGVVVTILLASGVAGTLELPARDLALRLLPRRAASGTVVVAVDEQSLREHRPWPWPRADLARIVERCADAGARGVVLDILLSEPRPGDEELARALRRLPTASVAVLVENEQWLIPSPPLRAATVIAHGNFELDHDGILRSFASTKQNGQTAYTALSLEAASMLRRVSVPVGRTVAPAFRTPPHTVPRVRASDVIHGRALGDALRNRIVFVGPTALGLGDRVLTPVSDSLAPDAGVTVHAAATESLLRDEQIRALSPITGGALAAVAMAIVLHTHRRSRGQRLAIAGLLALSIVAGGQLLLGSSGHALPFITLLATVVLTAAGVETTSMNASLEDIATKLAQQRAHDVESKRLLAHELKTPLASMRSLTQLLSGFTLTEGERRRVAVLLEAEAGKLQTMVEALLDLERLPLRDFHASSSVIDLGALVADRVEVLRASAGRAVHLTAAPDLFVRADAMLLERVIDNLVGNALKYTKPPIDVRVSGVSGEVVLEVEDGGEGIAAADRERIFQRFFRGSTAGGTVGLGLGLSLVAEVARWHGGSVAAHAGADGGALFRMTLPRAGNRGEV